MKEDSLPARGREGEHAAHHREDPSCAAVLLRCFAERLVALVLGRGKPAARSDTLDKRINSKEFG